MSMIMKKSAMVKPAKDTPKLSLWLSRIDMMIRTPYSHTGKFFIYKPNRHNNNNNSNQPFMDANILKQSLSETLVPFYPMTGRLKISGDRYEIDCNAEGALFVEVETSHELADFGDFRPSEELHKVMIPTCDYSQGISSFPLLMVQLTRFKCGGVSLGFAHHHHVGDGVAISMFENGWARVAKGLGLGGLVPPVHDRIRPRYPPQINFVHTPVHHFVPTLPIDLSGTKDASTCQTVFKLSKEEIKNLKLKAGSRDEAKSSIRLSTFDVVAAHILRCASKARGLSNDEEIKVRTPIDGRSRLNNPALPKGYFGNVFFFAFCTATARDLARLPLASIATKVHTALKSMGEEEFLRSTIDYLESKSGLPSTGTGEEEYLRSSSAGAGSRTICPNISVNSWARLSYDQEMDFGWGYPTFFGISNIIFEGQFYLVPSRDDDGSIIVATKLFKSQLPVFEKHFYDHKNLVEIRVKSSL